MQATVLQYTQNGQIFTAFNHGSLAVLT